MGIRSNRHGKKSNKETQSPVLNIFAEMMERDKRSRQGEIEQRNLVTKDQDKRKSKHFPPRSARDTPSFWRKKVSGEPLTADTEDLDENKTFVRSHAARQPDRPSHPTRGSYQRSSYSSRPSRGSAITDRMMKSVHDDTCSVACAFKKLAGSEYGCIVCLLLVFSMSILFSCCMVYSGHQECNRTGTAGSSGRPGTPYTRAGFGPNLRELNMLRDSESQERYSSSSPLMLEKRDDTKSNKIKDFYKKLVQTDAKIQYLKQLSQVNSHEPNENKPMTRLKRSLKWYKYPKRVIEKRYDDFDLASKESTTSDEYLNNHESDPKDSVIYQDDEPRVPTAFVIERKKMIVQYDPPLSKKIVPKCSHFQKEYSTHHHEHQLKHPFYQNTQKVDELLDKFLNKNLPEVVTDPFGFNDLFKNNTKLKCTHSNVKDNYIVNQKTEIKNKNKEDEHKVKSKSEDVVININSLRCANSVNTATKNKNNRDFRTPNQDKSQKHDSSKTKTENLKSMLDEMEKGLDSRYMSQGSITPIISENEIMISSTLVPSDKDKFGDASLAPPVHDPSKNFEYQAPNTRHLMQLNEDEENLGYEDFKEILTDEPENQDDNDRRVDSRKLQRIKRSYENRDPIQDVKQWFPGIDAQAKQPENLDWINGRAPAKLKPPCDVHNPNWKGALPLYPDEVNSMLKVASEDMLSEKPNSISTAHKNDKEIYKNRPTLSRRQDTFSDVDYIEDYFDNKYSKLTQMAQAYSDYGVLEAKKDVRKEKNKVAEFNESVDRIESADDKLSRKRRNDVDTVLFGYTPSNDQKNEDYIVDTSSWKNFVSKVLGKLVKISNKSYSSNMPDAIDVTGISLAPEYSMSTTTMSALEYPTMPLSYPLKPSEYNSKMKAKKLNNAKAGKASYYEVNKGRALLSTLEEVSNNGIKLENYSDGKRDNAAANNKNNVLDNWIKIIDLKNNEACITEENNTISFLKNQKDLKDLKLRQNQTSNSAFSLPTLRVSSSAVIPTSNITNNLPLYRNYNFENFAEISHTDKRNAIKPITIKELFEAFRYAKNHTKLCDKDAQPVDTLDSFTDKSNISKPTANNTLEDDMIKSRRTERRVIDKVKTNVHDTIFVANDTLNENQLKFGHGLKFSNPFQERNDLKTKIENATVKSNITENVGYRSRVLLATNEDSANKTGKESEIDIEVSIQKNSPNNVTKREIKTVPTTSSQITIQPKNKTLTETNLQTSSNAPNKDSDIKQKVKRNVDDINLIAWSDIYDDDYGIQTDEFNLNHKKNDNDFIKRSGKWVQDKIRKFAENLKGHDAEVVVKKRAAKDGEDTGSINKPNYDLNRKKRSFMHLGSRQMFHGLVLNLPVICKNAATAVQKTRSIEVSEVDAKNVIASSLMEQMVKLMVNMVTHQIEQRTCAKLPPDLQKFLVWLTVPEKETLNGRKNERFQVAQHETPPDYEPLISLYNGAPPKPKISADHPDKESIQDYYNHFKEDQPFISVTEFAQRTSNLMPFNEDFDGMYQSTVQSIKELLDMFNEMKPEEKNQMAGVRMYLQKQLLSLNRMMAKNQIYDTYEKTNWPQGTQRPYKRLQQRHQVKQTNKKHTRTTVNQTVSIAVTDQINVKKKPVTKLDHIKDEKETIARNNKRNLQDVYYKAIADAKKFGTRFAKTRTTQSVKSLSDSALHTRESEKAIADIA